MSKGAFNGWKNWMTNTYTQWVQTNWYLFNCFTFSREYSCMYKNNVCFHVKSMQMFSWKFEIFKNERAHTFSMTTESWLCSTQSLARKVKWKACGIGGKLLNTDFIVALTFLQFRHKCFVFIQCFFTKVKRDCNSLRRSLRHNLTQTHRQITRIISFSVCSNENGQLFKWKCTVFVSNFLDICRHSFPTRKEQTMETWKYLFDL